MENIIKFNSKKNNENRYLENKEYYIDKANRYYAEHRDSILQKATEKIICPICKRAFTRGNQRAHMISQIHIKNLKVWENTHKQNSEIDNNTEKQN